MGFKCLISTWSEVMSSLQWSAMGGNLLCMYFSLKRFFKKQMICWTIVPHAAQSWLMINAMMLVTICLISSMFLCCGHPRLFFSVLVDVYLSRAWWWSFLVGFFIGVVSVSSFLNFSCYLFIMRKLPVLEWS